MRPPIALVTAVLLLLGSRCSGGGGMPAAVVLIDPPVVQVQPFETFTVDVIVSSQTPVQSFEFDISVDPALALPYAATPHPDFDDDGRLFIDPTIDIGAGRLRGVVDFRHGGPGKTGTFRIATIHLWAQNAGQSLLYPVDGGLASESAQALSLSVIPSTLNVSP